LAHVSPERVAQVLMSQMQFLSTTSVKSMKQKHRQSPSSHILSSVSTGLLTEVAFLPLCQFCKPEPYSVTVCLGDWAFAAAGPPLWNCDMSIDLICPWTTSATNWKRI